MADIIARAMAQGAVSKVANYKLKYRGKTPSFNNTNGASSTTKFTNDPITGITTIDVSSVVDGSFLTVFEYVNSLGKEQQKLIVGDVIECVLVYKTNAATNKDFRLKLNIDGGADQFYQLTADGQIRTYKKYFVVGTDVNTQIRFRAQYSSGMANMQDVLYQWYCRKYSANTYGTDITREVLSDFAELAAKPNPKMNIIEVSPNYTSADVGWNVSKFTSIIDAHNYITDNSEMNRYTIKVHAGTYSDWETKFPGFDGAQTYTGIICKDYVYYVGDDSEKVILKWDGFAGFTVGHVMTTAECMQKCLFHNVSPSIHTSVSGFTLSSKNTRYCFHSESAGQGMYSNWELSDCIIDWGGRPNASANTNSGIGVGMSCGEVGKIKNIRQLGSSALYIHNNPWNTANYGGAPAILPVTKMTLESLDANGNYIQIQTISANGETTYDELHIKDCANIGLLNHDADPAATRQNWKVFIEGSTRIPEYISNATTAQKDINTLPAMSTCSRVVNGTASVITKGTLLAYTDALTDRPLIIGDAPNIFAGVALADIPADGKRYLVQTSGIIRITPDAAATFGAYLKVPVTTANQPTVTADKTAAILKVIDVSVTPNRAIIL